MPGAPPTSAVPSVIAHQVGSPELYWAIGAELLLLLTTAVLLLAPRWGASLIPTRRFRIVGLAAALTAALITGVGKLLEVWPGHPLFPSGHTAYAVTAMIFVAGRDPRWWPWAVPWVALMGVALVLALYHDPVDILGGLIVGLAVGLPAFYWLRRSSEGRSSGDDRPGRGQPAARAAATSRATDGRSSGPSLR